MKSKNQDYKVQHRTSSLDTEAKGGNCLVCRKPMRVSHACYRIKHKKKLRPDLLPSLFRSFRRGTGSLSSWIHLGERCRETYAVPLGKVTPREPLGSCHSDQNADRFILSSSGYEFKQHEPLLSIFGGTAGGRMADSLARICCFNRGGGSMPRSLARIASSIMRCCASHSPSLGSLRACSRALLKNGSEASALPDR